MDISTYFHGNASQQLFGDYANSFTHNFGQHTTNSFIYQNISGRVLRGHQPSDFDTLTDNPKRKIVFLSDGNLLSKFIGLTGKEILASIGYPEEYIHALLQQETKFKLILFPSFEVKIATWDNLLELIRDEYPELKDKVRVTSPILKNSSYHEIQEMGGDALEVRKFLEDTINVNPLFTGSGFIKTEKSISDNTMQEYLAVNKRLDEFRAYCLLSFPV